MLRRRCIYKKVRYLTLTRRSRSHGMLPSALYIMWSMHVQSLKLQRQKTLGGEPFTRKFNIWPWPKVTRNVAQYPLHYVAYSATKFEVATSKGLGGDAFTRKFNIWPFDLGVNVTRNIAQYPLHHVTYSATKFEAATSYRLGDKFTRKYIIWPWHWGQDNTKWCHILYIMWPIKVQSLKLDTFTRHVMDGRTNGRTDRQTDGRTTDRLWHEINIYYFF